MASFAPLTSEDIFADLGSGRGGVLVQVRPPGQKPAEGYEVIQIEQRLQFMPQELFGTDPQRFQDPSSHPVTQSTVDNEFCGFQVVLDTPMKVIGVELSEMLDVTHPNISQDHKLDLDAF